MPRVWAKASRSLLAIPLLLTLSAQRAPEDCSAFAGEAPFVEPHLISQVERGRRSRDIEDTVIAEEVQQVARLGWRLGTDLRLPQEQLTFSAGTPLRPGYASREKLCLPDAPRSGTRSRAGSWPRSGRGRLLCLQDLDGDRRYEQLRLFATDYAMHVPQVRLQRTIALAAPLELRPNPLGAAASRRYLLRRVVVGEVKGDTARLSVSHASRDPDAVDHGRWDEEADEMLVYRLEPSLPKPIDRSDHSWGWGGREDYVIKLANAATVMAAGLPFTMYEASPSRPPGWNIQPDATQFARWIRFGCDGRSLKLGLAADD